MKRLQNLDFDKPIFDTAFDVLQSWKFSIQSLKNSKAQFEFLTQGFLKILAFSFNSETLTNCKNLPIFSAL